MIEHANANTDRSKQMRVERDRSKKTVAKKATKPVKYSVHSLRVALIESDIATDNLIAVAKAKAKAGRK